MKKFKHIEDIQRRIFTAMLANLDDSVGTIMKRLAEKELEKEIPIYNPISSDLDVLRRSIFSNLAIHLKKNQDRGYEDLSLFEIGPTFFGKNPANIKFPLRPDAENAAVIDDAPGNGMT